MRYLAIGAHPDDLELWCYGTLAKLKAQGHYIAVCNVANGCYGSVTIPPEELKKVRLEEARAAAAVIGADHFCADVDDMSVNSHDQDAIRRLADIIRIARPDVIIIAAPNDYHPDHTESGLMALHASFSATLPNYITDHPYLEKVPYTYYMDNTWSLGFEPAEWVDISDYMDLKIQALKCHKSQYEWLSAHTSSNVEEGMIIANSLRGKQCEVKYAEAFRVCPKAQRIPSKRVLP